MAELWKQYPEMHFSGICFGHQLISRLLGSELCATGEWELGHSRIDLQPIGKKLFRTEEDHIHLHQMHQDNVVSPPSSSTTDLLSPDQEVHVWGSSEHTKVQGLYVLNRIFTSQAHMAFDEEMVKREIQMRIDSGAIKEDDEDERKRAVETSHLEHDGEELAAAILRFLHWEDDGIE
jgi:GMP synthase-like glutamine amidotransferase